MFRYLIEAIEYLENEGYIVAEDIEEIIQRYEKEIIRALEKKYYIFQDEDEMLDYILSHYSFKERVKAWIK